MPELCFSALRTRAAQPTWCRSSLPGSSVDGSRCAKMAMTGAGEVVDVLDERDRLLATDVERRDGAREEDGVADGQDGQLVAELNRLVLLLTSRGSALLVGHGRLDEPLWR